MKSITAARDSPFPPTRDAHLSLWGLSDASSQLLLTSSMDPSHRLVPKVSAKSASVNDTAGSLGLHDTLQYGPRSLATEISSDNDFQERLENWEETQDNLKLTLQRNLHGLHMPMRLMMERKLVMQNPSIPVMPQSNIHLDILMGRDETLKPSDIFGGMEANAPLDIHKDVEKQRKL